MKWYIIASTVWNSQSASQTKIYGREYDQGKVYILLENKLNFKAGF